MDIDKIIDTAFDELKKSSKPFLMFKDLSSLENYKPTDDYFLKTKYTILKSLPFEKHTDYAFKLSEKGIQISSDFDNWINYKKSIKPKADYAKWGALIIAGLSLIWNIYQGMNNNELKTKYKVVQDELKGVEKQRDSYKMELNSFKDDTTRNR